MNAPGARRHRQGSGLPTEAALLSRLGHPLHPRLGRVVSEFLYFAAGAGLAPSPDFAGYRLVWSAAGKKEHCSRAS